MSKSLFNVVNPDLIVKDYGADTLRLYEMFLGPIEQSKPWNTSGIEGVSRFLRGALGGVPIALPALLRALRVGEKAAAVGYDWPDADGVRAKVDEELAELDAARAEGDRAAMEHELGDLLFALASWARKEGLDPEAALRLSLDRFSARFRHAELAADARGESLRELDDAARDALWDEAKAALE